MLASAAGVFNVVLKGVWPTLHVGLTPQAVQKGAKACRISCDMRFAGASCCPSSVSDRHCCCAEQLSPLLGAFIREAGDFVVVADLPCHGGGWYHWSKTSTHVCVCTAVGSGELTITCGVSSLLCMYGAVGVCCALLRSRSAGNASWFRVWYVIEAGSVGGTAGSALAWRAAASLSVAGKCMKYCQEWFACSCGG